MEFIKKSIYFLKKYIVENNKIPNEKEWNKIADIENCLSSKSLEYYYDTNFNKMVRNIIKDYRKTNINEISIWRSKEE